MASSGHFKSPRRELVEAIGHAILSPRIMLVPAAVLGALVVVIVLLILGFRSMRLDDLRTEVHDINEQRAEFLEAIRDAKGERIEIIDRLKRIEGRLSR